MLKRLTLEEKASLMQNNSPAIERLGIKAYEWWNEALHGVGRSGLATVFPQAIGMAASFDDALLLDVFTAVSDEARAKSFEYSKQGGLKRYQGLTFWTPNINIFRDPRWGRGQETYGEDPTYDLMVDLESQVANANADAGNLAYVTISKVRGKLRKTLEFASTNG